VSEWVSDVNMRVCCYFLNSKNVDLSVMVFVFS
jgi:hypothetical protein